MNGIQIVVQPQTGSGTWLAQCDALLPFVTGEGDSPQLAVTMLLFRVIEYFSRAGGPPLPEAVVRIIWPRKRVFSFSATNESALTVFGAVDAPGPMKIVVKRRPVSSLVHVTERHYRYSERRWGALLAASKGTEV